ncbi:unnamed protein product [Penicillium salamii]|nr:unnamed protein product [Penicillium salamii]
MVRRSLLLRVLLNTRILVPSTAKRCLHIARGLVNAAIPCEAHFLTQSSPYEAPFYARGARGNEGAYVLHRGARGSDSRGHGDSQARRQEGHHDTSECEERSPDIFGLGIQLLLYLFGHVSSEEPVAHILTRITVTLMRVEIIQRWLGFILCFPKFRAGRFTPPLCPWLLWFAEGYSNTAWIMCIFLLKSMR